MFNVQASNDNYSNEEVYAAELDAQHYDNQADNYPNDPYHQEQKKFFWERYYKMSGQWGEEP